MSTERAYYIVAARASLRQHVTTGVQNSLQDAQRQPKDQANGCESLCREDRVCRKTAERLDYRFIARSI